MITYPNLKINIGLYITQKRPDGFHNLETIFYPVDNKTDKLEINRSKTGKNTFAVQNAGHIPEDEKNLCMQAYRMLKNDYDFPELDITLTKYIPAGAGLGGGSADAAFTLKMINGLCNLNISDAELKQYALRLGSDVAFFIENRPCYATGRGEILEPVPLDLSHKNITIVKPDFSISTAEAFSFVIPAPVSVDIKEIVKRPIEIWKNYLKNDFEKYVYNKYPILEKIKNDLYDAGADYVSLSGSGSAMYAISDMKIPHKWAI